MTPQPALVCVHGGWHTTEHLSGLCDAARKEGFIATAPQLPSQSNNVPPTASTSEDINKIQHAVKELADAGHPVILYMHSYGGIVGTNATEGLLWSQRQAQDPPAPGGIVHIIYMASFVLPLGTSATTPFSGEMPPWCTEDLETGLMYMRNPRQAFYNHLGDDEARYWLKRCVDCNSKVVRHDLTYTPYDEIGQGLDATYLVCKQDVELPMQVQEEMAKLLGETRRMEYLDSGHCAMVGAEREVAEVVKRAWDCSKSRFA